MRNGSIVPVSCPNGSISCRSNTRFDAVSTQLAEPGFRCCHFTAEMFVLGYTSCFASSPPPPYLYLVILPLSSYEPRFLRL